MKVSLHIIVKVSHCRLDSSAVVSIIVPAVLVLVIEGRLRSSYNNTAIWTGNEVVIMPAIESQHIRAFERRWRWIGHNNATAESSHRNDLVLVLGCNGRRVCVRREDDPFGAD